MWFGFGLRRCRPSQPVRRRTGCGGGGCRVGSALWSLLDSVAFFFGFCFFVVPYRSRRSITQPAYLPR